MTDAEEKGTEDSKNVEEASPSDASATPEEAPEVEEISEVEEVSDAEVSDAEVSDAEVSDAEEIFEAEIIDPQVLAFQIEIGSLQSKLEQSEQEKQELVARLRTVSAAYRQQQDDVSATRARLERLAKEKEEIRRGEVVSALFDPLQNLRRAKDGMDKSEVDTSHTHGVELVIKQILSAFENLGMEEVPGKGSKFDPNLHEALTMMPVQDPALHEVVIEVFESGYRIGSRLIRPARVILGSYTAPEESPEAPEAPEPAEA